MTPDNGAPNPAKVIAAPWAADDRPHRAADDAGTDALPAPGAKRWYKRDKQKVIEAVWDGRLSFREACRRYALSYEEFTAWEQIARAAGPDRPASGRDRRRFHRIAVKAPATIRLGDRNIDCDLENLSACGALVMVSDGRTFPSRVTLEMPQRPADRPGDLSARIAWRSRHALGLEFLAEPAAVAARVGGSTFSPALAA